jgi:hypothetical protein
MKPSSRAVLALAAVVFASPAAAHHRQTDPVTPLTLSGDTPLPRVAAPGSRTVALAVQSGSGRRIVSVSPWRKFTNPALQTIIADTGAHSDPVVSVTVQLCVHLSSDPVGSTSRRSGDRRQRADLFQASADPTGTS